jgi:membrane-associated phospholipid phosphatase
MVVGALLVVVCYGLVDRPVARFIDEHQFFSERALEWPPRVSNWLKSVGSLAVVVILLWRIWHRGGQVQRVFLAIAADVVAATFVKQVLKWGFGRYWPMSWHPHFPSLLGTGDYGFHPFHHGLAYESFPSGHALVVCSLMALLWVAAPRGRWIWGSIYVLVCVALVGLNYHFVGDVIAGAVIGSITGVCVARGFGVGAEREGVR